MFFFFKKKTAYEMRISDWSSDVCSSDLLLAVIDAHRVDALGVARRKLLDSVRILLVVSKPIINVPQEPSDDHAGKRADGRAKANKPDDGLTHAADQIGRESRRARVCPGVLISVDAVTIKNKNKKI